MNITEYILKDIKSLTFNHSIKKAKKLCEEFPISHIFIVENEQFIGCFSESDIKTIENTEDKLAHFADLVQFFFADKKTTLLELIKLFADNDTNIIPVLDEQKNYIGYYDLCDILDVFSQSPFLNDESITLIVEKNENDYSMSEVSQVVESNGGKILGAFLSEKRGEIIQITINISFEDIQEIIQTFRRYDYAIITKHENDFYLEDLKNRSEYFQKYLNM